MALFDADRPLRVVVFFSGGASGFAYLADHDPRYGDLYEVVGGLTDDPEAAGIARLRSEDVPVRINDIDAFYDERGADRRDLGVRESFDAESREMIEGFDPDLVLLSGYMWILTTPVIDAYPTINVHPADLRIETNDGERRFVGFDPVFDAIEAGETETRSSVHFVTSDVDDGPLISISRPFPVHEPLIGALDSFDDGDGLRAYADAHQAWMKWEGDGPAIAKALELIARGRLSLDGPAVEIDGTLGVFDLGTDAVEPLPD